MSDKKVDGLRIVQPGRPVHGDQGTREYIEHGVPRPQDIGIIKERANHGENDGDDDFSVPIMRTSGNDED